MMMVMMLMKKMENKMVVTGAEGNCFPCARFYIDMCI